jgi:hypothetical protein
MGIVEQAKNDPNGEVRKAAAAVQPEPKPPAKHSGDAFRRER